MTSSQQVPDSDSEWEYEYDESQTESFYLTLDLPLTRPRTRKASDAPWPEQRQPGYPTEEASVPRRVGDSEPEDARSSGEADPALSSANQDGDKSKGKGEDNVQIIDLYTRNPLVSYQGQIYSCTWATTIGTDVLLTHPSSDIPYEPELKLEGVNVLAATGIKLLGTPVQLVPKRDERPNKSAQRAEVAAVQEVVNQRQQQQQAISAQLQANAAAMSDVAQGKRPEGAGNNEAPAIMEPLRLPIGPQNGRTKDLQARFLERIANAKARRGDTDKVIVNSKKKLTGSGWRAWYSQREDAQSGSLKDGEVERLDEEWEDVDEDEAEDEDGNDAGEQEEEEEVSEDRRDRDQDMHDVEDSIDSDDPEELLFPTKRAKKAGPPKGTTFEAAPDLYLTPAEREDVMRTNRENRREGSRDRDVPKTKEPVFPGVDARKDGDDGDVQMGGT